ncbi:IS3 family transposase [Aliarcobacter skirrowii]|uniref:IS3 family transposase n=1 Tax=Aliarcobacter skirrowii TaxID=28200 RepID=UPI0009EE77B8|nr:IS3 family transposase [Aliarcobacter skirrowii]MDX4060721.1 IS3 family transposase [Aliarcobacter skirrowii]
MSRKMTQYSAEFKTKIVLEVLKGEKTINEIAIEYNIIPKNIQNWKNIFLANAVVSMELAKAVKEYKEEIDKLKAKNDEYAKIVGKLTVENNWMSGKLKSLDSKRRQSIVEFKLRDISITRQSELLGIARSGLYYNPKINEYEIIIKNQIQAIYNEIPIYGHLKVHKQLLEDGFTVSANTVHKYRKDLGLKAVLAVRAPYTTKGNKEHPIYSYKLKGLKITRANQVWSTDISYIRIKGGFVSMAAVIDWYSKAVLSWRISNTMDTDLVMSVLNEALSLYPKPEIFNTDQGSQYTSYIHTDKLKAHGITISMNGTGRSVDNICIERFWRSAKVEKIYLNEYDRVSILKDDVKDYINFYNHKRFHESLEYKKPMEVYFNSMKINDNNYSLKSENVA